MKPLYGFPGQMRGPESINTSNSCTNQSMSPSHPLHRSVRPSACLSVRSSVWLSFIRLSLHSLHYVCIHLSVDRLWLSVYLSVCMYPSVCLFVCLYLPVCICQSVCCLSVRVFMGCTVFTSFNFVSLLF